MTSPAEGIRDILVAEGVLAGVTGWADRVGGLATSAKNVSLIDSGGRGGEVKVAIDYPSVQMLLVGAKVAGGYSDAYAKAKEIFDTLQGIDTPNATWSGLVSCVAVGQPQWLGRDDQDRPMFSLNFKLITTPENVGNRTY